LAIDEADVNRYVVLAEVGTDALNGNATVVVPFRMRSAADRPDLVSALTSLVQAEIEAAGLTSAEADTLLAKRLNVSESLFTNYLDGSGAGPQRIGQMAKAMVVARQALSLRAESDSVSAAQVDRIVDSVLSQALADLANNVPPNVTLSAAEIRSVGEFLATDSGITPGNAALLAEIKIQREDRAY